jgi:peptidyl-prolyl cis-trans isomerase D
MVMRQMRDNTKWIMLITGLAFVALMVFSWGMDVTGRTSGTTGEIGRVNGEPVRYDMYQAVLQNLYQQVQSAQQEPVSAQQNKEIEQSAWDQIVDLILVQQELERRGISVSDEEIRQAARFQPPSELRTNPTFQTDGNFDLAKYQQFLATSGDPALFQQLEAYYRDALPRGKLMRQISTGIFVSDAELWDRYRDAHETVQVRFVPFDPGQRMPDDSVTVTDEEMEQHWEDNQDDFEMPARATVKVVILPRMPTAADTAAARDRATALLNEVRGGANFDTVGTREARAERAATFEDLGTFGHEAMTAPFDTAAFRAPVGQPYGPVATSFGYHVLLVSKRTADSVTAKHILIPVTRTEESENNILAMADSLENLLEDLTIEEVGRIMGLEVRTEQITDVFAFVPGAGQVADGSDWAFEEGVDGDISDVFETDQAFYAMQLVSKLPGGVLPLADAKSTIRQILLLQKKVDKAAVQAQQLVEKVRAGTTLENAAAEMRLDVRAPGPFTRGDFVPGLGAVSAPIGAAFGLAPRALSDPVRTRDNVFVIQKISHTPADSTTWIAQKETQRRQLMQMQQQQRLEEWMVGLRAAAEIDDRRDEVLRAADDTMLVPLGANSPRGF